MQTTFKTILLALLLLTVISCSDDNSTNLEDNLLENLIIQKISKDLETIHNIDSNSISLENIQSFEISKKNNEAIPTDIEKANFITIPIVENGKVIGRVIKSNNSYTYYELSNWNKEINVFSLNNKENNVKFSTYLDDQEVIQVDFDNAIVNTSSNNRCSLGFTLCVAGCGVSALAIAASDGPAPVMDVYAVLYMATCTTGCGVSHCEDMN